jgi:hypothetical protein
MGIFLVHVDVCLDDGPQNCNYYLHDVIISGTNVLVEEQLQNIAQYFNAQFDLNVSH